MLRTRAFTLKEGFITRSTMVFWPQHRVARSFLFVAGALVCAGSLLAYANRTARPVLFYHGASPEAPQGTHIAILNPFRDRKDEKNAEWLIRDLRTDECEQIVRERLRTNPAEVCPVLRKNSTASLIWLDGEMSTGMPGRSRVLVYDLRDQKATLFVYFGTDEAGWGVSTVSVLR